MTRDLAAHDGHIAAALRHEARLLPDDARTQTTTTFVAWARAPALPWASVWTFGVALADGELDGTTEPVARGEPEALMAATGARGARSPGR